MDKKTQMIALATMVIVLAFLFFKRLDMTPASSITPPSASSSATPPQAQTQPPSSMPQTTNPSQGIDTTAQAPQPMPQPTPEPATPEITPQMREASRAILNQFQNHSRIQLSRAFENMIFQEMEGHNNQKTAAIVGQDTEKDLFLAVVSQKGPVPIDNVKKFLIDEAADVLKMDIDEATLNNPEVSAAEPGTGYSTARVWNLKSGTDTAVAALLSRSDNSGSDLIIFRVPNKVANDNIAQFEEILWDIKAK